MATQDNRLAGVSSPLGKDVLLLRGMAFEEHLSRPYVIELDLLSEKPDLKASDLLGQALTVKLGLPEAGDRFYSGLVSRFGVAGMEGRYTRYRAVCRPWLWFLTRASNCRIFQDMSVPDVLLKVFRDHGFTDFKNKLNGTYAKKEYVVQYRETDFDFVSRLMEHEGIYYFFQHADGKDTLVLADGYSGHEPIPGTAEVPYIVPSEKREQDVERVFRFDVTQEVETGTWTVTSYDFENPGTSLLAKSAKNGTYPQGGHERYDYPGDYRTASEGQEYAKVRLGEQQAPAEIAEGEGTIRRLPAGGLFKLKEHPISGLNREYLVLSTRQELKLDGYESSSSDGSYVYTCRFSGMDSKTQFRPARVTPVPGVRGPHTATVVGKSGEEIWTDRYGRVKVQFHWDRDGKKDENSSCWVRVAQMWSGGQFGGLHVPRMKEEVIVEFLEGDPDRPIITGRVYNGKNMPPYALPGNQTRFVLKTRSTPGGSEDNFNELRIEDKKDAEEIYFHAEKDFNRVVENNDTLKVGFDKKDPGDQTIEIFNDRTTTIEKGKETLTVKEGDRTIKIEKGNEALTVGKGNREVKIDTGNDALTVAQGNLTIKVSAGKITIEAMQAIELKCGASSIKMEPAKITVKAPQVAIQGDAQIEAKSPLTTVKGDATLILKGGMTMIN